MSDGKLGGTFFCQWQLGGKGMKDGSGFAPGLIVPQTISNARKNPRMDDPEGSTKSLDFCWKLN